MNPRKLAGAAAVGLLLLLGAGIRYGAGIPHEDWDPLWSLAYSLALAVAFFTALYDRKNFSEKTWDFDPQRGIRYFFFGWIVFPVLIGVEVLSGADLTLGRMLAATMALSVLMGILGVFTEDVGV